MELIKNLLLIIFLFAFTVSNAVEKPKYKKEKFKVWGNCEMCKLVIEKSAKSLNGVKSARWNVVKERMIVKYNPELTNMNAIQLAIAISGYDTELHKSSDESYDKLHFCCKYERPIKNK
jgi:cation transport ATPase